MGFQFTGWVLQGPRVSLANAATSGEATTGVVRDIKPVPPIYTNPTPPAFVDAADQYRTAILQAPGTTPVEYLVWAQNTGSLGYVDDPTWWTEQGTGYIPTGTLKVTDASPVFPPPSPLPLNYGFFTDGTNRVVVSDDGNRTLGSITWLVIARGDVNDYDDEGWVDSDIPALGRMGDNPYLWFGFNIAAADQDPVSGVVTLTPGQVALLGGGLSRERGDRIITVRYTIAPARFWWTKNDRYETRFGWVGKNQRWEPYKGSAPKNLGLLLFDTEYQLNPKLKNWPVNAYLPGDGANPDQYAMVRLGTLPGATSIPVAADGTFAGVRVKADDELEVAGGFDFSRDPTVSAVVGQTSGKLQFNPEYTKLHAGQTIWYNYRGFSKDENGAVGKMLHADTFPLFIAPIPGPLDHPLIKFGNRTYLQVTLVNTDALLEASSEPAPCNVIVSLSTGRLFFNSGDIAKADPEIPPQFSKYFLGEDVIYDGVALNFTPQPTKAPVQLVDAFGTPTTVTGDGDLYVPDSVYLPTEFASNDPYRGLGKSGILDVSDETGSVPLLPGVDASIRPGGDTLLVPNSGRVRQVDDGVGDTILFSKKGAVAIIKTVNKDTDVPEFPFIIPFGTAYVARRKTGSGSKVGLGSIERALFDGDALYFLQSSLTPAVYLTEARIFSRNRDIFRFTGTEQFYFNFGAASYVWNASLLPAGQDFYTATEVAASIQTFLGLNGKAYELNGRVVLEANLPSIGIVEIEWGPSAAVKDFSGAAVLGFLPGWRVKGGVVNWLPDSGASLGLFRSPVNLNRLGTAPDVADRDRLNNSTLQESISPSPFVFLDQPPLQDVAGYDENIFFQLTTLIVQGEVVQIVQKPLDHYKDIVYRFGQGKFDWVERATVTELIEQGVSTLNLQNAGVVPESMLGAPGIGGGLFVATTGGWYVTQEQGVDYVLPLGGIPGTAILTERFGSLVTFGARGQMTQGSAVFTDPSANFNDPDTLVKAGYRLKVTSGAAAGSYVVLSVDSSTQLTLHVPAPATPDRPVPWEVYTGFGRDVYDPSVVADMSYTVFQYLPDEPFRVRLLSPVGVMPPTTTRFKANMEGALKSGRNINIRYGLTVGTSVNTAMMVGLTKTVLGPMANGLLVPNTSSARFASGSFSIQVGGTIFSSPDLVGVPAFTGNPDKIEYLTVAGSSGPKGTLNFGTNILSQFTSAQVQYVEDFQPASALAALTVEYNPFNGELNFSQSDMAAFSGTKAYFVEQMITEDRQDVSISPLLGAFSFATPIPKDSTVEVEYWAADLEGRQVGDMITEFLPVFVRDEVATKDGTSTYRFNADLRTVDQRIEPIVRVGAVQYNFGHDDFVVGYPPHLNGQGLITFLGQTFADYIPVNVTYAVFEAQGGERSFESSIKPVYRPPFFIKAAQRRFGIKGDRTSDFVIGQMLRIGEECHYITDIRYYPQNADGTGDVTSLWIYPNTLQEVGSRAPGNDVLTLITDEPISTPLDPDGKTPIPTTAVTGFMSVINLTQFPFEPVNRGQIDIIFLGDLTSFAVAGHILEIGGSPFSIASAELTPDGTRTKITLTAPFQTGFSMDDPPTMKLSYRPIYPPATRDFLGVGQALDTEGYELVLYGETDSSGNELPGRTLLRDIEYTLNVYTGKIKLLEPMQKPLGPGQRLVLSFTRIRFLQPFVQNGAVVVPRFYADYLHSILPDLDTNGLRGGTLSAQYTFRNPDTFYFRIVTMRQFLGEAITEAISEITSKQPAGGALRTATGGSKNWEQGRIGIKAERRYLLDKDRAARNLLDFYNTATMAFEQVEEAISGGMIGDKDGKFRFWIGKGKDYPTPGYESDITGDLTTRNIWSEVFNAFRPALLGIFISTNDPVVSPITATLLDAELEGDVLDAFLFKIMWFFQRVTVKNDIDDLLLIQQAVPQMLFETTFPYFKFTIGGLFQKMGEQHSASRLFPTVTKSFSMMFPGVGSNLPALDPGVYTYGRTIGGKEQATTGTAIGQLHNPVVGDITNVSNADLSKRRPRARIWGYFPGGIPANSFVGQLFPLTGPCIIATPLLLRDFPLNPTTNFPDHTQLVSQNGSLPDLVSGDPVLAIPGWKVGDQMAWGQPTGDTYQGIDGGTTLVSPGGGVTNGGLFVFDIRFGCVIQFAEAAGLPLAPTQITDPARVQVAIGPMIGVPADQFPIVEGDTLYCVPPLGGDAFETPYPPTTVFEIQQILAALDQYRNGFDLLALSDGRLVDTTLPSYDDPSFGLKELAGQHPPEPMSCVEGPVEFFYSSLNPLLIPALEGKTQDDSGDYQIPYIKTGVTEMDRFDEAHAGIVKPMAVVDGLGFEVYPDEVLANDGTVTGAIVPLNFLKSEPATLITEQDALPGAVPVRNARPYDLLLIEVDTPSKFSIPGPTTIGGPQGIWSVGAVTSKVIPPGPNNGTLVEPPRFVTHTHQPMAPGSGDTGDPIRYEFSDAMSYVQGPYPTNPQAGPPPSGVQIIEDASFTWFPGFPVVVLDFSSIGQISLNNGLAPGVGNLNDIWSTPGTGNQNNVIMIKLISRQDADILWGTGGGFPFPWSPPGGYYSLVFIIQGTSLTVVDYAGFVYGPVVMPAPPQFGVAYAANPSDKHIILPIPAPSTPFIPWSSGGFPLLGQENKWFLPYTRAGGINTMIYGFEFAVTIDAQTIAPNGQSETAWIDQDRLTFHEVYDLRLAKKRGYVHPQSSIPLESELIVDEITVNHNGAGPEFSTINKWVNGWNGFNNPYPLTFLTRSMFVDPAVGDWVPAVPAVSPERGSIKAMSFEGFDAVQGNIPIVADNATISVLPSNERLPNSVGRICEGIGIVESKYDIALSGNYDDRVIPTFPLATGSLDNIEVGDILVVGTSGDAAHPATTKAGTGIIRHAVSPNTVTTTHRLTSPTATAGAGSGWAPVHFPTIVATDFTTGPGIYITLSDLAPCRGGDVVPLGGKLTGFSTTYFASPTTPRIYFIRDMAALGDIGLPGNDHFRFAVLSARYTLIDATGDQPIFTIDDLKDARGNPMLTSDFRPLIENQHYQVSGMIFLPVNVSGADYGLPPNNCVGYDDGNAPYGFRYVTFQPPPSIVAPVPPIPLTFDGNVAVPPGHYPIRTGIIPPDSIVPVAGTLGLGTYALSNTFQSDPLMPIYEEVVHTLDISNLSAARWRDLNIPPVSPHAPFAVDCLLPQTVMIMEDTTAPIPLVPQGHFASVGIFLEPSVPRTGLNLNDPDPRVVDKTHSLDSPAILDDRLREIGARDASYYRVVGGNYALPEVVRFQVRRIRRFHDVLEEADKDLKPLRFAYEIRRGRITAYAPDTKQFGLVTASAFVMDWETTHLLPAFPKVPDVWNDGYTYTGTNLGPFDDPDVNVNPGDLFRVLDDAGNLIEEVEIASIEGPGQIKLAPPGLVKSLPLVGQVRFEVYIRKAPVPHEQSNEQLIDLLTDKMVAQTDADWVNDKGGYVPELLAGQNYSTVVNQLYDDLNAPGGSLTFSALGVKKGDIVVIDPAGTIPQRSGLPVPQEKGVRPIGDLGVPIRGPDYLAGRPNYLDDNRGFYRVIKVVDGPTPYLGVNPVTTFTGEESTPVVFDPTDAIRAYAIYPTIDASVLRQAPYAPVGPPWQEGQMDLRPTRVRNAVTQSYVVRPGDPLVGQSIRPFSYKIIRPSKLFTDETIDLVLVLRERMLSWIELIRRVISGLKGGSYFIFQRDLHIEDLGFLTDPESGLGVLSDAYIMSLIGRLGVTPFSNTESCLSMLDRRFWIFDIRLDRLTSDGPFKMKLAGLGDTPYTAYTAPLTGGKVRPVEPDRIEEALNSRDRFRPIRYTWIAYRTHKTLGTLASIKRYDLELPERLAEQRRLILLRYSAEALENE